MAKVVAGDTGWAGRVPPHNTDAERCALGAMLLDKESCFRVLELLNAGDFYQPAHSTIFEIIRELFQDKSAPADLIVVTNRLKERGELEKVGGAGYLSGLVNVVPTVENAEYYAKIVRDKAMLRECIKTASRLSDWSYREDLELDEIIERASGEFLELSQKREERDFISMSDLAPETFSAIESMRGEGASRFLETGFSEFDNFIHGFYPGEYVVIAARPSVGKTSWALNVATHLARAGRNIAIFSIEMPKEQLAIRVISCLTSVPTAAIIAGNISDAQLDEIRTTVAIIKDWGLFIDDTPTLSPLRIRTKLKRLLMEREGKIDLAIIDYLQLLDADRGSRGENRVQEVTQMSRSLKALSREVNIPILVISQLSRHIEKRDFPSRAPMLSDLRESGAIEQDADKVLFLQRVTEAQKVEDDVFTHKGQEYTITEDGPTPVLLYVSKNRNGPTGKMLMGFTAKTMKFGSYTRNTTVVEITR